MSRNNIVRCCIQIPNWVHLDRTTFTEVGMILKNNIFFFAEIYKQTSWKRTDITDNNWSCYFKGNHTVNWKIILRLYIKSIGVVHYWSKKKLLLKGQSLTLSEKSVLKANKKYGRMAVGFVLLHYIPGKISIFIYLNNHRVRPVSSSFAICTNHLNFSSVIDQPKPEAFFFVFNSLNKEEISSDQSFTCFWKWKARVMPATEDTSTGHWPHF